jgi:hypothetical protein
MKLDNEMLSSVVLDGRVHISGGALWQPNRVKEGWRLAESA